MGMRFVENGSTKVPGCRAKTKRAALRPPFHIANYSINRLFTTLIANVPEQPLGTVTARFQESIAAETQTVALALVRRIPDPRCNVLAAGGASHGIDNTRWL